MRRFVGRTETGIEMTASRGHSLRASRPLANPRPNVARSSAALSLSMLFTSLAAAAQAVAIVVLVNDATKRDAFFAAYSCYLPFVLWAASVRGSLVPLFGPARSEAALRAAVGRLVSTVVSLGIALSVGLAVASPVLAAALIGDLSGHAEATARNSVLTLAPAVALQFVAASLSAGLAAARRFTYSAAAYSVGSALALVCTLILLKAVGVLGAPAALLIGAAVIAGAHVAYLRRLGLEIRVSFRWLRIAAERFAVVELLAAAALLIAQQINLSLALAALPARAGAITAYTLAFFVVSLLLNVSFSALALASMPDLVARTQDSGLRAAERQLVAVSEHAFLILAPLLACLLAFGKPLLVALIGPFVARSEIDLIYSLSVVFSVMAVVYGLFLTGGTIILALRRWRRILVISAASVAIQGAALGLVWGRAPETVAVFHVGGMTVSTGLLLAGIFGRTWWRLALRALQTGAFAAGLATVYLAARLAGGDDEGAWRAALLAVGASAVYGGLAFALSKKFRRAVVSLVRR